MLATITALTLARLEREGNAGNRSSVALTERFIEVMESEHRELGLGDPTLGRTVRRLVGMLARRTELWRSAGQAEWDNATRESLYKDAIAADALEHSTAALRDFSNRLEATPLIDLEQGGIA
jgi:cytochrome b pre-mRNA-processing protein 3